MQADIATSTPWPDLLAKVRQRSPLLVGPMDDWFNTAEFFVHAEDVRRAQPGWTPLPVDGRREGVLWRVLRRTGRAFFRHATVGVVLALPDGRTHTVRDGSPAVDRHRPGERAAAVRLRSPRRRPRRGHRGPGRRAGPRGTDLEVT